MSGREAHEIQRSLADPSKALNAKRRKMAGELELKDIEKDDAYPTGILIVDEVMHLEEILCSVQSGLKKVFINNLKRNCVAILKLLIFK